MKNKTITEIEEYLQKYKYDQDLDDFQSQKSLMPECLILKKHNVGTVFYDFHHHDLYEILYIVKGKVVYLVENKKYTLESGEMVLISPSILHKLQTIVEEPCERIVITFTERFAKNNSTNNTDLLRIFKVMNESKYHKLSFNNAYKRKLEALLDTMQRIMFEERYGTDVIYNASFCSLMVLINSELESNESEFHPITFENELILEAGNYIEDHLHERLSVDDIAKHVSLSASRLHHVFKYETGISILKYINKKRLAKAKELLKTGDPIINIYHKCGFQDYTSFFRAFKKEYNITPKEFQNKYFESVKNGFFEEKNKVD